MNCSLPIADINCEVFPLLPGTIDQRMWVLSCGGMMIAADPNLSDDAAEYIEKNCGGRLYVILTHEHYDHTNGVNRMRELAECSVICSRACAERLEDPRKNLSYYFAENAAKNQAEEGGYSRLMHPFSCSADVIFEERYEMDFSGHRIEMRATPGHSVGSICAVIDGRVLISGDSLVPGVKVVTKLPTGNMKIYEEITLPYLQSLPPDTFVLPGHYDCGLLGEMLLSTGGL